MSDTKDRITDFVRYAATPQAPKTSQIRAVAKAGVHLRKVRDQLMKKHSYSLRDLYRTLEVPGDNPLKSAHEELDLAVRKAYGMTPKANALEFLFLLNQKIAQGEASMQPVISPGLPPNVKDKTSFITNDSIQPSTSDPAQSRTPRGRSKLKRVEA